jgi:hypothetical protein
MKKNIIFIIGITLLIVCVGLSGCNESIKPDSVQSTTLFDGTLVTGDIEQLEITNHSIEKMRDMRWNRATQKWYKYDDDSIKKGQRRSGWLSSLEVPWDLDITNISTNLTKRKNIYFTYIESNESKWELDFNITDEPFSQFKYLDTIYDDINNRYEMNTIIISNVSLKNDTIWYFKGTVKNIGDSYLNYVNITVNFYDENNTWLANETDSGYNITSGYSWNFNIKYDIYHGKYTNDISYVSFELNADLEN